jgi:hypothetical protein
MDTHAQSTYLREVASQCQFAINATLTLNQAMKVLQSSNPANPNYRESAQAEVFRSVHSLLTHSSNISRILWPPRPRTRRRVGIIRRLLIALRIVRPVEVKPTEREQFRVERATALRAALALPDDGHPLKSRKLRDHLEHFDERLDQWVLTSARRNFVQDTIGPWGRAIVGIEESDCMRWYDPESKKFLFRGESVDLQALVSAIDTLLPLANAKAEQLWYRAAQASSGHP